MIPIILITFFASLIIVNAETGIQTTILNYTGNTYSRNVRIFSNNNNIFSNWGRSYITFNVMIMTSDPVATLYPIEQISVFSTNNIYVCQIGNTNMNLGESEGKILVYDVVCDTNIGVNGIQAIDVTLYQTDGVYPIHITTSQYMTIFQNLDLNISQVLQQQQAITQGYLNTIHSAIDLNGTYIVSAIQALQTQQIQAINNQTQQQQQQHEEIMEEDIDSTSKQNVDETKYNDYKQKEDTLMQTGNNADLSGLSIGIDTGTSETIWQLITRIIQSNAKVFGLFISILSIGIIKLALAR